MKEAYGRGNGVMPPGGPNVHWSLCYYLATLALEDENEEMLKAILEVHDGQVQWEFHRTFDKFKHEGGNPESICIVENSGFKRIIPQGNGLHIHPLDWM
jgi:hypothetical protein